MFEENINPTAIVPRIHHLPLSNSSDQAGDGAWPALVKRQ